MAWTTPRDWVALETVTASIMNTHVRDNLAYLKATPSLSTLTLTGGAGASSITLPATGRIYLDGGGNSYIVEGAADNVAIYAGGVGTLTVQATGVVAVGGFAMATWPTVAGSANCILANGDFAKIATSLRKYKRDIATLELAAARAVVLALHPITYRAQNPKDDQRVWPGFLAEEVEEVTPDLVVYDTAGALQSVAYDRVATYLTPVVQDHERRLAALEARCR